jgi:hypothetical protein
MATGVMASVSVGEKSARLPIAVREGRCIVGDRCGSTLRQLRN